MSDLRDIREEYESPPLHRPDLHADPVHQFDAWFQQALEINELANAAALATATADARPSARMMLLKGFDADGFVFFTDYESRKGAEIAANPQAALLFYWQPLYRQVRIGGRLKKCSVKESEDYFVSRPLGSRLAASISHQSRVVSDRSALESAMQQAHSEGPDVERPERWGGYLLVPEEYEFWQGRPSRLHDRFRYLKRQEGWRLERLMP